MSEDIIEKINAILSEFNARELHEALAVVEIIKKRKDGDLDQPEQVDE